MQRPCAYAKMGVWISCMLSLSELLQLLSLERARAVEALVLQPSDDLHVAKYYDGQWRNRTVLSRFIPLWLLMPWD